MRNLIYTMMMEYNIYAGTDVRSAEKIFSFEISETYAVSQHSQAMAPVMEFERFKPVKTDDGFMVSMENVPLSEVDEPARRLAHLPEEIAYTGDKGIKLKDVLDRKNTMEEFIAQFADNELSYIICGEGMGSPRVTAGTASALLKMCMFPEEQTRAMSPGSPLWIPPARS